MANLRKAQITRFTARVFYGHPGDIELLNSYFRRFLQCLGVTVIDKECCRGKRGE